VLGPFVHVFLIIKFNNKIVPLTNVPWLSFAEASDRVSTVLGMYKCSSEKQVQTEKHCGSWVNGYRRRCLGHLFMYFL